MTLSVYCLYHQTGSILCFIELRINCKISHMVDCRMSCIKHDSHFCSLSIACKGAAADLLFLIDSSTSISPVNFMKMKEFMKSLVRRSVIGPDKVHVGVTQFSSNSKLEFPLTKLYDKPSIEKAIDSMQQMGGGTLTGKSISEISQYFDPSNGGRPDKKRFLLVVTDGESQDEVAVPAKALREKGVLIFAIGVDNANTKQLLEISGTQQRVYPVADFDGLRDLERQLALSICDPEKGELCVIVHYQIIIRRGMHKKTVIWDINSLLSSPTIQSVRKQKLQILSS